MVDRSEDVVARYMAKSYEPDLRHDDEDNVWVCTARDLPGCVATGDTAEEALSLFQEMKKAWFEAALEMGMPIPEPTRAAKVAAVSGKWLQRVPRELHAQLVAVAASEQVSLNQYVLMVLARAVGEALGTKRAEERGATRDVLQHFLMRRAPQPASWVTRPLPNALAGLRELEEAGLMEGHDETPVIWGGEATPDAFRSCKGQHLGH